jgi:hypothetical protein
VGELEKTRKLFKTSAEVLEKKEESIYFYEDSVIKFFANEKINTNRITRAAQLSPLVPEIIDSSKNFYKYKKIEGKLLATVITREKFKDLLEWTKNNLWKPQSNRKFDQLCKLSRIETYTSKNNDSQQYINHEYVPPIHDLFSKIDTNWLCAGEPVQYHGDFILDNILETEDGFCLLDWRQDFAGDLTVGDIYYDLAKLNHNLTVNHEIVNQKLFDSSHDNCYILCNSKLSECKNILKDFVIDNGYDWKKVEVLTAIVWINMAPLHDYPFNKFLFNFGKLSLKRALNNEN